MTSKAFDSFISIISEEIKRRLTNKGSEYGTDDNRFYHNYRLATLVDTNVIYATIIEATKHYITICEMAKKPDNYTDEQWDERMYDMMSYLYIIQALLYEKRNAKEERNI